MTRSFETVSADSIRDLIGGPPGLRVSVYVPVPPFEAGAEGQLMGAYRVAVKEAASRMSALGVDARKAGETTRRLQQQPLDWDALHPSTRAIGVLLGPEGLRPFAMTRPVEASVVQIGRTFHLRPLLASAHLDLAYRVVSLGAGRADLFEGDAWGLRRIEGDRAPLPGSGLDDDAALASLAAWLRKAWSGRSDPIVLVAAPALARRFRELADLPGLLDEGVNNGVHAGDEALHARAGGIVRGWIDACDRRTLEGARAALSLGRATEELRTAAEVAVTGGVSNVLVAPAARVAKHIDVVTGALLESLGDEDALDELCALVLERGGEAAVIDWEADEAGPPFIAELRRR